ncbi:MAG TPA: phosphatase domain-containing protein [Burkholderiales bacterium]|nr:phosphatase domain-containing protein [Burkholderiales bacterium]
MGALGARAISDPIIILPYLGYGTPKKLTVCGRVLEDEGFRPAATADGRWRNLIQFWKRLESDEVPGARVRAAGKIEALTDREGYFRLELHGAFRAGWNEVELELVHPAKAKAIARVLVPDKKAKFGLISDIDDTVVYSNVTRKLRMVFIAALTNARTRKPFKGVAAFYRALHAGVNPVFYVSKSPWNLFAPIVEYLEVQGLPEGPVLLRDFGLFSDKNHKTRAIEQILQTYPALKFVLSGDSGEQDPEIYAAIVRRFPERIRAIYIRSVDPRKIATVGKLAAEVAKTGCQLILAPEAEAAAMHAAAEGLIQTSELRAVRSERVSDESRPSNPAASTGGLK